MRFVPSETPCVPLRHKYETNCLTGRAFSGLSQLKLTERRGRKRVSFQDFAQLLESKVGPGTSFASKLRKPSNLEAGYG